MGWLTKPSPIRPLKDNTVPFIRSVSSYGAPEHTGLSPELGPGEKKDVNKTDKGSCILELPPAKSRQATNKDSIK